MRCTSALVIFPSLQLQPAATASIVLLVASWHRTDRVEAVKSRGGPWTCSRSPSWASGNLHGRPSGQFAEINGGRQVAERLRWGCVPILCFFNSTNANFGCRDAIRGGCSAFINFSLS